MSRCASSLARCAQNTGKGVGSGSVGSPGAGTGVGSGSGAGSGSGSGRGKGKTSGSAAEKRARRKLIPVGSEADQKRLPSALGFIGFFGGWILPNSVENISRTSLRNCGSPGFAPNDTVPHLRRSDPLRDLCSRGHSLIPQPFRAGLTFGGRPLRQAQGRLSGPRIRGDCRCHFSLKLPQAKSAAPNEETIPPASFLLEWHGRLRFAVSHISRKTREIWGTLD